MVTKPSWVMEVLTVSKTITSEHKASRFLVIDLDDNLVRCNYKCCQLAYGKSQVLQLPLHVDCFITMHITQHEHITLQAHIEPYIY